MPFSHLVNRSGLLVRSMALWCALIVLAPASALADPHGLPTEPLRVAASTPIFADIVANVGGERTDVYSVMPMDADPHTWEASPPDIVRLMESDTFIFMGAHLEPFIESGAWRRAAREAGIAQLRLADETDLIAVDRVIDHGDHVHDLRDGDPHVWLDPGKVIELVDAVEAHLAGLDPTGTEIYAANANAYRETLESLDHEIQAGIDHIPPERRKLVVFHDAYTYFAARYEFEVIGVVLKSPEGEPSAREIAELHDIITSSGVTVVFKEPQFNSEILDRIAEQTGVAVGELLTDNFAGRVDTYVGLMRFNLDSLMAHLAD